MSIQAHMTTDREPIEDSAICSRCEGDAGLRIRSWVRAKDHPAYNDSYREPVEGLVCSFCGRKR